jgi:hypothetical protein
MASGPVTVRTSGEQANSHKSRNGNGNYSHVTLQRNPDVLARWNSLTDMLSFVSIKTGYGLVRSEITLSYLSHQHDW